MKEFLSIKEAAQYLGVEYKTVWRAIQKGELPAAKIGGVYRIRRGDIHALFGVRALQPATTAREETADMFTCACCGADIGGELDIGGHCEVCGAPICTSCWLLERRRRCREHSTPAGLGERDAMQGEASAPSAPVRCGRCLRVLGSTERQHVCAAPGCDQYLCDACWSHVDDRFCRLHIPGKPERLEKARQDLAEGRIPCLVTCLEAKKAEIAFTNRFDHKIRSITSIRHPLDGTVYRILNWDNAHESGDEVARLLDALGVGFLDKSVADTLPMNLWSRYTVPNVRVAPGQGMIIELRCVSHLESHASVGFDTTPFALAELFPMLQKSAQIAEANRRPHILGLASTTGWDEEAVNYVSADASGRSYAHRFLLPFLIDLNTGSIFFNKSDDRALPFVALFSPTLESEDIRKVIAYVREYLMTHEALLLTDIVDAMGVSESTARRAAEHLVQARTHKIERIGDMGLAIMRRPDR